MPSVGGSIPIRGIWYNYHRIDSDVYGTITIEWILHQLGGLAATRCHLEGLAAYHHWRLQWHMSRPAVRISNVAVNPRPPQLAGYVAVQRCSHCLSDGTRDRYGYKLTKRFLVVVYPLTLMFLMIITWPKMLVWLLVVDPQWLLSLRVETLCIHRFVFVGMFIYWTWLIHHPTMMIAFMDDSS